MVMFVHQRYISIRTITEVVNEESNKRHPINSEEKILCRHQGRRNVQNASRQPSERLDTINQHRDDKGREL